MAKAGLVTWTTPGSSTSTGAVIVPAMTRCGPTRAGDRLLVSDAILQTENGWQRRGAGRCDRDEFVERGRRVITLDGKDGEIERRRVR